MFKRIIASFMILLSLATSLPVEMLTEMPSYTALAEGETDPAAVPTAEPTAVPATAAPTVVPATAVPTAAPTAEPTEVPLTEEPTEAPTEVPMTEEPTEAPTAVPATKEPETAEATAEPTTAPAPVEPTAEQTEAPETAVPPVEPTEIPETAVPTAEPTEKPIDTTRDASYSPEFRVGYAEVLKDMAEVMPEDAEPFYVPEELVVYAAKRNGDDELLVWMDVEEGMLSGWIGAEDLRPMDEAEILAFVEAQNRREDVRFLDKEKKIPLALTDEIVFPEEMPEETPVPEATEVPETTELPEEKAESEETPEPTAVPEATGEPEATIGPEETLVPEATVEPELTEMPETTVLPAETAVPESADEPDLPVVEDVPLDMPVPEDIPMLGDEALQTTQPPMLAVRPMLSAPKPAVTMDVEPAIEVCAGDVFAMEPAFSDGVSYDYAVTISDEAILFCGEDGRFSALQAGEAELTFTSEYAAAVCAVRVKDAPESLFMSVSDGVLGVNECVPVMLDGIGTARISMTYASSDENVATVSPDGFVTAVSAGECTLTATAYNGASGSCTVKVYAEPQQLTLSAQNIRVRMDRKAVLTAAVDSGSAADVIWNSSDENVAVCDGEKIVCVGPGTCEITASLYNGLSALCRVEVCPVPEAVTLPYATLYIGVGESVKLEPDVGGTIAEFAYKSGSTKYVKVSADGTVKGVKKGSAKVRVLTDNGKAAYVTVKVYPAPKKVTANPKSLMLGVGEKGQLGYSLPKGTAGRARYASENPAVVTVDAATGAVEAVGVGKTRVLIRTYNGKKAYASVEVRKAPAGVNIVPAEIVIGVGQTINLSASVDPGAAGSVSWSSVDASVAACAGRTLKGMAVGTAEVIATAYNGVEGKATVTVLPAPEAVTLPYATLYVGVGESVKLEPDCGETIGSYSYKSSNTKYVKVSADGTVKGVKKGSAKVRVMTYNGKTAYVTVKVYTAPSKVTANPKSLRLGLGEKDRIGYSLPKGTTGRVSFSSENPAVVTVDAATGAVEAVGTGKTRVVIRTYNGKKAYTTVEVKNAPEFVNVSPAAFTIGVGQTVNLSAVVNSGAAGRITLAGVDGSIVACSGASVRGLAVGTTEVIATAYNGATGKCTVTVVAAPTAVTLPYSTLYVGVGESVQLTPKAGEIATGFSYKSSKTKYVKVSAGGVVKGVKKGSAKVRVMTYNGKTAYITVKVCTAPKKITAAVSRLDLGVGEKYRISYKLPSGTASSVTYSSSDTNVVSVNASTGEVTAVGKGQATVTLRTFNNRKAICTVTVYDAPDRVQLNAETLEMGGGQTFRLKPEIPAGSKTTYTITSSDNAVAKVSADGLITAVARGTAVVRVQTHVPEVYAQVELTVWNAPTEIRLDISELTLEIGQTYQMNPVIPEGSYSLMTFASSDAAVASVTQDGFVQTLKRGQTTLSVSTYNGKTASIRLRVWDPLYPETMKLHNQPEYLMADDGDYALEYTVEPSTAEPQLQWSSSNMNVATVDQNGVIHPKNYGYSQITAVSAKNSAVKVQFTLTVQMENLTLTIPARTTQESGIAGNLAKIENIRKSAVAQVQALKDGGVISASDAAKRMSIINNIFKDYAFVWKTPAYQKYWKAANSEGGVKDFKTDRVYYGMPYTSGSSRNRAYNSAKAVSEGRFTDSGQGYYLLNRGKLLNGSYVGNDCSALVNAAIWGASSNHIYDRTSDIAVSKSYKTVGNYKNMRPGDLLCKSSSHVVMFLYYANPEKTKIMIIENGGEEAGTNTVHCAVHNLSYYTGKGYKVRRLSSLGN